MLAVDATAQRQPYDSVLHGPLYPQHRNVPRVSRTRPSQLPEQWAGHRQDAENAMVGAAPRSRVFGNSRNFGNGDQVPLN